MQPDVQYVSPENECAYDVVRYALLLHLSLDFSVDPLDLEFLTQNCWTIVENCKQSMDFVMFTDAARARAKDTYIPEGIESDNYFAISYIAICISSITQHLSPNAKWLTLERIWNATNDDANMGKMFQDFGRVHQNILNRGANEYLQTATKKVSSTDVASCERAIDTSPSKFQHTRDNMKLQIIMDTAKLGWLNDFVSSKSQEVQGFFTTYSDSLNSLQTNFSTFKDKLKTEIEDEAAQAQKLQNIMESLKSMNLVQLNKDLDNLKSEMDTLVAQYKGKVVGNNELAAKVYDTYAAANSQVAAIKGTVETLNGEVGGVMSFVDEYKRVMNTDELKKN
eukprot:gene19562-26244_t